MMSNQISNPFDLSLLSSGLSAFSVKQRQRMIPQPKFGLWRMYVVDGGDEVSLNLRG
jgi:hypothetical protein